MTPGSPAGCRILVAEDNPVNATLAQRMLSALGFSSEPAPDGLAAVEAHQAAPFDIIFMDLQMPRMDGIEAARKIREIEMASPAGGHVQIVALTADAMSGDRQRCLDAGMDDYISKPIRRQDLSDVLSRTLSRMARTAREETRTPTPFGTGS